MSQIIFFNLRDSPLQNMITYETIRMSTLNLLINSNVLKSEFRNPFIKFENEKKQLEKYKQNIINEINDIAKVKVQYTRKHNIGRVNPSMGLGLHCIRREIRHTLANEFYTDIDIVNAHPNFLEQLCKNNNIECECLTEYINNRETILNDIMLEYNTNKEESKRLIIRLMYLGAFKNWALSNKITKQPTKFLIKFEKELNKIASKIVKSNPELIKILSTEDYYFDEEINNDPERKTKSTVMSYILQEIECQCLETIYKYSMKNDLIEDGDVVLSNDGLLIRKDKFKTELLEAFSNVIKNELKYNIRFTTKEMNQDYPIEFLKKNQIIDFDVNLFNDTECAKVIYHYNKNKYIFCQRFGWYEIKQNNTIENIGLNTPVSIYAVINDTILKLIPNKKTSIFNEIYSIKKDKDIETEDKNNKINELKNIIKKLESIEFKVGQTSFQNGVIKQLQNFYRIDKIDQEIDANQNLIAFDNCVFDNTTKQFREIKVSDKISKTTGYKLDADIYYNLDGSIKKIITKRNLQIKNELEKIIKSIFSTDEDYDYLMNILSKSLFGNSLEICNIWVGAGRNGKGTLSSLLQPALGSYYKQCSPLFLTSKSKSDKDADSTLAQLKGVRIAMISEPESEGSDVQFNTTKLKSLSGNDRIETRDLFKSKFEYAPQFTMFVQTNQLPTIPKIDDGIKSRLKVLTFPYKFVEKPQLAHEKKIDITLKKRIESPEYRNEFILMLIEDYACNDKPFILSKSVQKSTDDYLQSNDPLLNWFKHYIIIDKTLKHNKDNKPLKLNELLKHYKDTYNTEITNKSFTECLNLHLKNDSLEINLYEGHKCVKYIKLKYDDESEVNYLDV